VPLRTDVPRNTGSPRRFSTGNDSPVSAASLSRKSFASSTTASAGTRLPAASSTTSPGTISAAAMRRARPSRTTSAVRASRRRSALTAVPARYSWAKPSAAEPATMARMMSASNQLRSTAETAAPNTSTSTSGLANWRAASASGANRGSSSTVLAPWRSRALRACAADSPSEAMAACWARGPDRI
jgi:hypothetical protein